MEEYLVKSKHLDDCLSMISAYTATEGVENVFECKGFPLEVVRCRPRVALPPFRIKCLEELKFLCRR